MSPHRFHIGGAALLFLVACASSVDTAPASDAGPADSNEGPDAPTTFTCAADAGAPLDAGTCGGDSFSGFLPGLVGSSCAFIRVDVTPFSDELFAAMCVIAPQIRCDTYGEEPYCALDGEAFGYTVTPPVAAQVCALSQLPGVYFIFCAGAV